MKQQKVLRISLAVILILVLLLIFLLLDFSPESKSETDKEALITLSERDFADIKSIAVNNEHGGYTVFQEEGGFYLEGISADILNIEYLQLLLDECSIIMASQIVSNDSSDLASFGLEAPKAEVHVEFIDGSQTNINIGDSETLSDSVYMQIKGDEKIYLMPRYYAIRFLMPIQNYIQYQITPQKNAGILEVMKSAKFSGSSIGEPIIIDAIDQEDKSAVRDALLMGITTHVIKSPSLHEMDQDYGSEIFQSLMPLISEGIISYNFDDTLPSKYGFNFPYLVVEFAIDNTGVNAQGAISEALSHSTYKVTVVKAPDGTFMAMCNDNGVIYKIKNVAFTELSYEKLVSRWFMTPLMIDVSSLKITSNEKMDLFTITNEGNNEIIANLNGKSLDIEAFRSYYRLLTSACNDGSGLYSGDYKKEPLLEIKISYNDTKKQDDLVRFYEVGDRKALIEVNGEKEFLINRAYIDRMMEASEKINKGEKAREDW